MSVFEHAFDWRTPEGVTSCRVSRQGEVRGVEFPGYVTFRIEPGGDILFWPKPGCPTALLRHFLVNQVIPRYLGSRGRLIVHASAVALQDGRAVVFLGATGYGKSTLAASFHASGAPLLADDCVLLKSGGAGVVVVGSYPGIRLDDQSVAAADIDPTNYGEVLRYSGKRQAYMDSEIADPLPVAAVFELARAPANEECIRVSPVRGSQLFLKLAESAFSLDPEQVSTTISKFNAITALISNGLSGYLLEYPRIMHRLPEVRAAIEHAVTR